MHKIYCLTVQADNATQVMMTLTEMQSSTPVRRHKHCTSEFSLCNGFPEHANFSSPKHCRSQGNKLSSHCRLCLHTDCVV